MKGFMQLQTIIYVIFAVIILMVGIFSVESYLTNLKVDANYELDEMDLTVIGKRITSSCYLENNVVEDFLGSTAACDIEEATPLSFKLLETTADVDI